VDANRFDDLARTLSHRVSRRTALGAAVAGLALGSGANVAAQEATVVSSPAADADKPVFMFVQTAMLGRAEVNPAAGTPVADGTPVPGGGAPYLLTLEGHSGQTIYFSDRPDRIVGAVPTEDFLEGLGFTPANPPNAALVAEFAAGDGVVVLALIDPVYDPETLTVTYGAEVLDAFAGEGLVSVTENQVAARLPAEFEQAALFIDDCPNFTTCAVEVCFAIVDDGEQHIRCWLEDVGPIPTGPFKACFSPDGVTCVPCEATIEQLAALCNEKYPAEWQCDSRCVPT
jgi:hypothetical protein